MDDEEAFNNDDFIWDYNEFGEFSDGGDQIVDVDSECAEQIVNVDVEEVVEDVDQIIDVDSDEVDEVDEVAHATDAFHEQVSADTQNNEEVDLLLNLGRYDEPEEPDSHDNGGQDKVLYPNDYLVVAEASKSVLIGLKVNSVDEAHDLYKDYAYGKGFNIRCSRQHKSSATKEITTKEFRCNKYGTKFNRNECPKRIYTKRDVRTNCKAYVKFGVHNGVFTVTKHEMRHNHELCPTEMRHLLKSHREVSQPEVEHLVGLSQSGMKVSCALRHMRKQMGGAQNMKFTDRDGYNAVAKAKRSLINKCDANSMINKMQVCNATEENYFFRFELTDGARLACVFWRDSQMRRDFEVFGDTMVVDATYRTNTYGLKCVPFVGINHHGKNVMFGCAMLTYESTNSYVWLFETFLSSMDGKEPETIMTDQSQAMAAAIKKTFKSAHHRLCVWHLMENSKNHIGHIRNTKAGFSDQLHLVMTNVETEDEFEYHWKKLLVIGKCQGNKWLHRLYNIRKYWCPAFSKQYFSGGILSSQRSESTNHAISKRVTKKSGLCDFWRCYVDVVDEWREKERVDDFRCFEGNIEILSNDIKILKHARDVYTPAIYNLFERQFVKGISLGHKLIEHSNLVYEYRVGTMDVHDESVQHAVVFDELQGIASCTCNMISQVGILCSHVLRIFNVHSINSIPTQYIRKRWTKKAKEFISLSKSKGVDIPTSGGDIIWRLQMVKKFSDLITSAQSDPRKREIAESMYSTFNSMIQETDGVISTHSTEPTSTVDVQSLNIENPRGCRPTGERNTRWKSIVEKKCNGARRRMSTGTEGSSTKSKAPRRTTSGAVNRGVDPTLGAVQYTATLTNNSAGTAAEPSVDGATRRYPILSQYFQTYPTLAQYPTFPTRT